MPNYSPEMGQILDDAQRLMENCKYSDAIEALEEAASIDPQNPTIWERVVICNLELKRPKKALEAMNSILSVNPERHQVWADKAYLHLLLQEDVEGVEALKRSLTLKPRNHRDWFMLGAVYMANEEWDDARDALHNALQLNPNDSATLYNLAAVNYILGDIEAALGAAELATAIDPITDEAEDNWYEDLKERYEMLTGIDDTFLMDIAAGS